MKRILTLIACAIALSAGAQIPYEFPYNPDADNDAFISTTDLVEFLALFGQNFTSEELYLSDDSTEAIVFVGDLIRQKCIQACSELAGNWTVCRYNELMKNYSSLAIEGGSYWSSDLWPWVWVETSQEPTLSVNTVKLTNRNTRDLVNDVGIYHIGAFTEETSPAPTPIGYEHECWCATQQRPRVEYSVVEANSGSWNGILNSMAEEGWLLLPQGPFGNQITFWRWAD